MLTLLALTEEIYHILEPYFKPKEPKLVKFEIINYLLFRLFYDEIINITDDMPLDYFNALPEIFSYYVSNPTSRFMQGEILKRNRMYVHVHYFVKYEEGEEYSNLSIILFTLIKYISTKMNEKKIKFPDSIFDTDPSFPSDPGETLSAQMEELIITAFKTFGNSFSINLN
jgi:hypothetical protein